MQLQPIKGSSHVIIVLPIQKKFLYLHLSVQFTADRRFHVLLQPRRNFWTKKNKFSINFFVIDNRQLSLCTFDLVGAWGYKGHGGQLPCVRHVPLEGVLRLLVSERLGASGEGRVGVENSVRLRAPMRVGPRGSPPVTARQLWLLLLVIVGAVVGGRGTRVVGVLVDCRLVMMTERERERERK